MKGRLHWIAADLSDQGYVLWVLKGLATLELMLAADNDYQRRQDA